MSDEKREIVNTDGRCDAVTDKTPSQETQGPPDRLEGRRAKLRAQLAEVIGETAVLETDVRVIASAEELFEGVAEVGPPERDF